MLDVGLSDDRWIQVFLMCSQHVIQLTFRSFSLHLKFNEV
jgi:hypothetical protein